MGTVPSSPGDAGVQRGGGNWGGEQVGRRALAMDRAWNQKYSSAARCRPRRPKNSERAAEAYEEEGEDEDDEDGGAAYGTLLMANGRQYSQEEERRSLGRYGGGSGSEAYDGGTVSVPPPLTGKEMGVSDDGESVRISHDGENVERKATGEDKARDEGGRRGKGGDDTDGYEWSQYGSKHIDGGQRVYLKCRFRNCPVKKIVEHCGSIASSRASFIQKLDGEHTHEPTTVTQFVDSQDVFVEAAMKATLPGDEVTSVTPGEVGRDGKIVTEKTFIFLCKTDEVDMFSDGFSWRKYGEKSVKGQPHKRSYYRCSTSRQCKARKTVEQPLDAPARVTYKALHSHAYPDLTERQTDTAASSSSASSPATSFSQFSLPPPMGITLACHSPELPSASVGAKRTASDAFGPPAHDARALPR